MTAAIRESGAILLLQDIQTRLYQKLAYLSRLQVLIGASHLPENDAPPRIVLYPTTEQFGPAKKMGKPSRNDIASRLARFEAHLWGETPEQIDGIMIPELVAALRERKTSSVIPVSGEWKTELNSSQTVDGALYVLTFTGALTVFEGRPTAQAIRGSMGLTLTGDLGTNGETQVDETIEPLP